MAEAATAEVPRTGAGAKAPARGWALAFGLVGLAALPFEELWQLRSIGIGTVGANALCFMLLSAATGDWLSKHLDHRWISRTLLASFLCGISCCLVLAFITIITAQRGWVDPAFLLLLPLLLVPMGLAVLPFVAGFGVLSYFARRETVPRKGSVLARRCHCRAPFVLAAVAVAVLAHEANAWLHTWHRRLLPYAHYFSARRLLILGFEPLAIIACAVVLGFIYRRSLGEIERISARSVSPSSDLAPPAPGSVPTIDLGVGEGERFELAEGPHDPYRSRSQIVAVVRGEQALARAHVRTLLTSDLAALFLAALVLVGDLIPWLQSLGHLPGHR